MNEYLHFESEDFMQDPSFRDWAAGTSPQASAFWEAWLLAHPERHDAVLRAKENLEAVWAGFDQLPEAERTEWVNQIKQAQALRSAPETPVRSFYWGWWSAAAGLVLLLGLAWGLSKTRLDAEPDKPARMSYRQAVGAITVGTPVEVSNSTSQPRRVTLPDGSVITMAAQSRISYAPNLGPDAQRTVYLSGEAFFKVAHNPSRPFLVYANGVVTKVLGTSFRVKAYEGSLQVTVQVRTGRVSVFAPQQVNTAGPQFEQLSNGIVLTPNQQVVLTPEETLVKSIVPQPLLLHPEKINVGMVYTDTPLSQIFKKLEESYGIEILYDEATFKECLLTARLYEEPLLDQLTLICKTVGATYTVMDARVLVSGEGCR